MVSRGVIAGGNCDICGNSAYWNGTTIVAECIECGWVPKDLLNRTCSDACKNILVKREHDKANNKVQCTTCSGTGKVSRTVACGECTNGSNDCVTCKGTGKVMHTTCSGNGYTIENNNCGHEGANGPHYYCTEHGLNIEQYHLGK
ncbi:MAG: hypothetical protein HFJ24_05100 [Clostridia bacterium]|nr:hypothetical protein [Clostridia bacterium]MCI9275342.1 hypothetical protein [Clostridia bacterium]